MPEDAATTGGDGNSNLMFKIKIPLPESGFKSGGPFRGQGPRLNSGIDARRTTGTGAGRSPLRESVTILLHPGARVFRRDSWYCNAVPARFAGAVFRPREPVAAFG